MKESIHGSCRRRRRRWFAEPRQRPGQILTLGPQVGDDRRVRRRLVCGEAGAAGSTLPPAPHDRPVVVGSAIGDEVGAAAVTVRTLHRLSTVTRNRVLPGDYRRGTKCSTRGSDRSSAAWSWAIRVNCTRSSARTWASSRSCVSSRACSSWIGRRGVAMAMRRVEVG